MYGGLKKSASRLALVAAAGVLSTGAYAADLGGDCCADLEERVAELEATTARKGNRKVSLTVSGQVNRAIMWFNDGGLSNTYFGLDNTNSSTRFGFSGSAKISPATSAGFSILIDVADKARTYTASQFKEDATSATGSGENGDHILRLRDANWWLENQSFGRVTVGRLTTAGAVAGIDLAGIQVVASSSPGLVGGGLFFRNSATGALTQTSLNVLTDGGAYPTTRGEGVRWNSPTFAGFTVGASIAEASSIDVDPAAVSPTTGFASAGSSTGRNIGVDLKYAGEFSGVRIAAGIGWEKFEGNGDGVLVSPGIDAKTTQWGGSLALMHVPTGLFVQGDYLKNTSEAGISALTAGMAPIPANAGWIIGPLTTGKLYAGERDATRWQIQGGISQNFFGIGKTALYGEYGRANDWMFAKGNTATDGDSVTWWGVGVVQTIDAAAMDLYLGYRNFSAQGACGTIRTGAAATPAGQTIGMCTAAPVSTDDIHVVTGGARIRF